MLTTQATALEFGRHRIFASTGLLIGAIVEEALSRDERVSVTLTAFGHEWRLIGPFGAEWPHFERERSRLDAFDGAWLAR